MKIKKKKVDGISPVAFAFARKTMAKAFQQDLDFRAGYVSNVAMLLNDRHGISGYAERNQAAEEIIHLIFET